MVEDEREATSHGRSALCRLGVEGQALGFLGLGFGVSGFRALGLEL